MNASTGGSYLRRVVHRGLAATLAGSVHLKSAMTAAEWECWSWNWCIAQRSEDVQDVRCDSSQSQQATVRKSEYHATSGAEAVA